MFDKFIAKLKSLAGARAVFDPSRFGDPVATQTAWTPAKGGGANFQTHKLAKVDFNRVEFRAAPGAKLFCGVFIFAGLAVMIAVPVSMFMSGQSLLKTETLWPVLFGLIFAGAGGCLLYFGTIPAVFDKRRGYFWKGRKTPDLLGDRSALKSCVRLDEIHAVQLVSEWISGSKSSYYSYELNLVLHNASRINVVDHGNLARLKEDARELAAFLGKPLWDPL